MKFPKIFIVALVLIQISCSDDDPIIAPPTIDPPMAMISMDQTVDIASTVTIDGSQSTSQGSITYEWTVSDPSGAAVTLSDNTSNMIQFDVNLEGNYNVQLDVTNESGTNSQSGTVTSINPTFVTADQMGRPAINTVFNFFGDADAKNGFNLTTPDGGNADPASFKGILDALQGYIGLDAMTYTNALGLDNATTASVLATDVLMSNKDFPSTYGPSNLTDIRLGENVLNGRGLNDDVIDVTLILTFGADLTGLTALQQGLITDNVQTNDVAHSSTFPYLAQPN